MQPASPSKFSAAARLSAIHLVVAIALMIAAHVLLGGSLRRGMCNDLRTESLGSATMHGARRP